MNRCILSEGKHGQTLARRDEVEAARIGENAGGAVGQELRGTDAGIVVGVDNAEGRLSDVEREAWPAAAVPKTQVLPSASVVQQLPNTPVLQGLVACAQHDLTPDVCST